MLTKRIIPCLDIKNGQTVKGTNFMELRNAGDPVELGEFYSRQGADELVFLDITASNEQRKTLTELVERVAAHINIPFTVGGGISQLADVERLLNAGADKISINSTAINHSELIDEMAQKVGEEAVETVIEACNGSDERLIYEGADLLYHLIVLLTSKGYRIEDLANELKERHSDTWKKH